MTTLHFPGGDVDTTGWPEQSSGKTSRATAEELAALEPPWRDFVIQAADALPDCVPFAAMARSLREHAPLPGHPKCSCVTDDDCTVRLEGDLNWLSGACEVLDALGDPRAADVGRAYDLLEGALRILGVLS